MLGLRTGLPLDMHAPLKRKLVVGPHPGEAWNSRIQTLKIHKVQWVPQSRQRLTQFRAEPRLSCSHAVCRTPLNLAQLEIVRYVLDGLDAHLRQFFHRACMDSWQIADVVIRARRIATVEEFTGDGIDTVATGRDVRCLRH